ncbi:MAG: hypothetical protein ACFCD0_12600 [Gemmataceae bacterium]
MRHSGLLFGTLMGIVLSVVAAIEFGALCSVAGAEKPYTINTETVETEDLFESSEGWQYRHGQPTHWKYLVTNR